MAADATNDDTRNQYH